MMPTGTGDQIGQNQGRQTDAKADPEFLPQQKSNINPQNTAITKVTLKSVIDPCDPTLYIGACPDQGGRAQPGYPR